MNLIEGMAGGLPMALALTLSYAAVRIAAGNRRGR